MAPVLYEPAFTVLAKHFTEAAERRRAMTAMTLVAALASFIFLPLAQALIDAYGWRDALLVLAVILAATTIPLHALVLRPAPRREAIHAEQTSTPAREALRSLPFWLLTIAFVLALLATIAMTIFAIPFLLERGHSPAFAAFTVGLVGVSQIPGRLLFAPLAARLPGPLATASVFVLIAVGVIVVVSAHATTGVVAGLVLLGMGNGMATLARATAIADLYGAGPEPVGSWPHYYDNLRLFSPAAYFELLAARWVVTPSATPPETSSSPICPPTPPRSTPISAPINGCARSCGTSTGLDTAPLGRWLRGRTTPILDDGRYVPRSPRATPTRAMLTRLDQDHVVWPDGARERLDALILATGYRPHLDYLAGTAALAADGSPLHRNGVSTAVPGLGYVGLEYQRSIASATVRAGSDATQRTSSAG